MYFKRLRSTCSLFLFLFILSVLLWENSRLSVTFYNQISFKPLDRIAWHIFWKLGKKLFQGLKDKIFLMQKHTGVPLWIKLYILVSLAQYSDKKLILDCITSRPCVFVFDRLVVKMYMSTRKRNVTFLLISAQACQNFEWWKFTTSSWSHSKRKVITTSELSSSFWTQMGSAFLCAFIKVSHYHL